MLCSLLGLRDATSPVSSAVVRHMVALVMESMGTCPACAHTQVELMPVDTCQYFYQRKGCGVLLKPKAAGLLRVLLVRYREMPAEADR